jgi:hypothetical protein
VSPTTLAAATGKPAPSNGDDDGFARYFSIGPEIVEAEMQSDFTMGIVSKWRLAVLANVLLGLGILVNGGLLPRRIAAADEPQAAVQEDQTGPRRHRSATRSVEQLQKDVEEAEEADDGPATLGRNGEYETVKLADGSEVEVEKWEETFDAYDYRPSVTLDDPKAEEILWFRNLGPAGMQGAPDGMQVDSKGGKVYWAWTLGQKHLGLIARCNLNGSNVEFLVKDLRAPHELVLDLTHDRMYWLQGSRDKFDLMTARMSGKDAKPLVEGLNRPNGLALDARRGELYYWEKPGQIVRVKTDGTREELFLDKRREHHLNSFVRGLSWNPKEDKLYWLNAAGHVRRAGREATNVEEVFDAKISLGPKHTAFDFEHHQSVFPSASQLVRENLDGSGREVLVTSPPVMKYIKDGDAKAIGMSAAIDEKRQIVYWSAAHFEGTAPYAAIFRMELPPRLKPTVRPAPPLVTAIAPEMMRHDDAITIRGEHLAQVSAVTFVDDSTCEQIAAKFQPNDDHSLSVTVPKLGERCEHPLIIVETPSGVTVTLRKDLTCIKRNQRYQAHRLTDGRLPQFWLMPEGWGREFESAVVYINHDAHCRVGTHGHALVFLKNGALGSFIQRSNCTVYHEPFALLGRFQDTDPTIKFHQVPAIRPSFLDNPVTYKE